MSDDKTPIILIGTDALDGAIIVVGIYEDEEKAQKAVQSGVLPNGHYSVVKTKLNSFVKPRELPIET